METNDVKPVSVETKAKKGYEFLRELCAFNADFNAFRGGSENPITNRVQYIMHQLDAYNIAYTVDKFEAVKGVPDLEVSKRGYVNIVVEIEGTNKEIATVFSAHHDVANMGSENCEDNSASVANLLDLCVQLSKEKPTNNVVICFNDAEEIVNPSICGSQRIAQNILKKKYGKVKGVYVLELTANGRNYWMSHRNSDNSLALITREIYPLMKRVRTPYNDGYVIEGEGVPSVCIGSLDDINMAQVTNRGYCQTWAECHRITDTFDNHAVENDMDLFVNFLETLI